jgi:subtilase family serine protease
LPPAAAGSSCTLSIVYTTAAGAMTGTAPAYNSSWAGEIALDVQWAHATAPMARIVLLEAPDATVVSLNNAVALAGRMGPGVVSMSFGASEWAGETGQDHVFTTPGMTYFAATGDAGTGVEWPSAAPYVVAVGGTTLTYKGATRSEVVWSKTGGGISAYEPQPAYQAAVRVPGQPAVAGGAKAAATGARRGVADVAFNADVNTGQYVVMSLPSVSKGATLLYDFGGTSLSTPQWAGIAAIVNALRAATGIGPLGDFHAALYTRMGSPGIYAGAFADVTQGSDGTCASCSAGVGYDLPTGFGTPNANNLLGQMVAF